jgi:hypothetical protein
MTSSKSTLAENKEKAAEEPSNTKSTVCEHEQTLSEDERINVTKETLKTGITLLPIPAAMVLKN